jgi:hypothetical protein
VDDRSNEVLRQLLAGLRLYESLVKGLVAA